MKSAITEYFKPAELQKYFNFFKDSSHTRNKSLTRSSIYKISHLIASRDVNKDLVESERVSPREVQKRLCNLFCSFNIVYKNRVTE